MAEEAKGHVLVNGVNVIATEDHTWFFARDIMGLMGRSRESGATVARKYLKTDQHRKFNVKEARIHNGCFISDEGILSLSVVLGKSRELIGILNQGRDAVKAAKDIKIRGGNNNDSVR